MDSGKTRNGEIAKQSFVVVTATPLDNAVPSDLPCASCEQESIAETAESKSRDASIEPARISIHILNAPSLFRSSRLGLTLVNPTLDNLTVASIDPSSPLIHYIQPGYYMESFDGEDSTHAIPQVAYRLLQKHSDNIHLVFCNPRGDVKYALAVAFFPEFHSSSLGLTFQKHHENLAIKRILPNSLFSTSLMQPRDQVVSINGESCVGRNSTEATTLACQDRNRLSIVTRTPRKRRVQVVQTYSGPQKESGNDMITAEEVEDIDLEACVAEAFDSSCRRARFISLHIVTPTPAMMEGLALSNATGSFLEVVQVPSEGPFASSPLRAGVSILSINERSSSHLKPAKAFKWMRDSTRLSLIAMDLAGDPDIVEAVVCKPPSSSIGIVFRQRTTLSPVRIHAIRPDGLFVNSVLNTEDVVLEINGIPCEYSKPTEVVALVQRDSEYTSIVAKPEHAYAIVLTKTKTQNEVQSARSLTFICDMIIALVCFICFVVFG